MGYTLALALGKASCALAYRERGAQPQLLHLPALSAPDGSIPTALYVAADGDLRVGQAALLADAERRRCFQRIPEAICAQPEPAPRQLDGAAWDVRTVGRAFISALLSALPFPLSQIERLLVSMPHFESAHVATRYARWLHESLTALALPEARLHIMSELDAAALRGGVWSAQAPAIFAQAEPEPNVFGVTFAQMAPAARLSARLDQALREGVPFASLMTERCTPQTFAAALEDCFAYAADQALYPTDLTFIYLGEASAASPLFRATERSWGAHAALETGVCALAEGLLQSPPYLLNSYGLRYRTPEGDFAYLELAPSGTPFPRALRTVRLAAAYDDQPMLECVIGMLDPQAKGQITLSAAGGALTYTLEPSEIGAIALNEFAPPLCIPVPQPVRAAEPCVEAAFRLDAQRQLRVTAADLRTGRLLLEDAIVTTLH
jgi:hypothetical protein